MKLLLSLSALQPSLYREHVKGWNKDRYADLFAKYNGDRKGYRIYIPLKTKAKRITIPKQVKEALHSSGYVVEDYVAGIASQIGGKRKMRIGKLLPPELQQVFANDPARQAQASDYLVVISRHPYDIAGMSTGRGWRSCMNLVDGSNRQYVAKDLRAGSLVAYLVKSSDLDIKNPSARVLLRVYKHEGKSGLWPSNLYGTAPAAFKRTLTDWCAQVNRDYFKIPEGVTMKISSGLYSDGLEEIRNTPATVKSALSILDQLLSKRSAASEEDVVDISISMICSDSGAEFMRAATKLPAKKFVKLCAVVSSAVILSTTLFASSTPAAENLIKPEYVNAPDPRTKYALMFIKYWAPFLSGEQNDMTAYHYAQLNALAVVFAPEVKLTSTEFARSITMFGAKIPDSRHDFLPPSMYTTYKKYGMTSDDAARLVDKESVIDPAKLDPDLKAALTRKFDTVFDSRRISPGFASIVDRDQVVSALMQESAGGRSPIGIRMALSRCTKAQVAAYIKSRGGILNVVDTDHQWLMTKWKSYVASLLYKALRPKGGGDSNFRTIYPLNVPLLYLAAENANLTDNQADLDYCARVLVLSRSVYRRTIMGFITRGKFVNFGNSAAALVPVLDRTPAGTIGKSGIALAAEHLPTWFANPKMDELLAALKRASFYLDDYDIGNGGAGAIRVGNPMVSLPFALGTMSDDDIVEFADEVISINPAITREQILDMRQKML